MTIDPMLLFGAIAAMWAALGVIGRMFVTRLEQQLKDQGVAHVQQLADERAVHQAALLALRQESDLRFQAMKEDRDYVRAQMETRQDAILQLSTAIKTGVDTFREGLLRLAEQHEAR